MLHGTEVLTYVIDQTCLSTNLTIMSKSSNLNPFSIEISLIFWFYELMSLYSLKNVLQDLTKPKIQHNCIEQLVHPELIFKTCQVIFFFGRSTNTTFAISLIKQLNLFAFLKTKIFEITFIEYMFLICCLHVTSGMYVCIFHWYECVISLQF